MKLSKYTVFYPHTNGIGLGAGDPADTGECLVYNTRTQGVLRINKEVKEFIGRVTSTQSPLFRRNTNSTNGTNPTNNSHSSHSCSPKGGCYNSDEQSCLNTLLDSGIIIDKETDENRVMDHWFSEIKYRERPLHATILTTFKCNFACTYCFEERVKDERSMDDQTAEQVIAYLQHKAEEKKSHKIRLMFYGGEPLMNPKAVIKIATELQQWTKERGIKFSFGMITNGSLVRKELMEQLVKLGLTSIRITLDGDKAVHDSRRPFLDGRGSFETIIRNIEEVLGDSTPVIARSGATKQSHINAGLPRAAVGAARNDNAPAQVKVELGANFDRANIAGLHRLLDYLEQKGLNKRISRVLFAPVVSRLGADDKLAVDPHTNPDNKTSCCQAEKEGEGRKIYYTDSPPHQKRWCGGEDRIGVGVEPVGCHKLSGELAEEGIKLERELIQRGYRTPSSVKVNACPMTMDDSMLVIDPAGDIYKCEAFVGREQFCIGNVRTKRFNHRYAEFITMKPWQAQECLECPYVPMCGGGCRYIAQLKHGDYTKPACDKEYYEKIFPQLLKMDYERGVL